MSEEQPLTRTTQIRDNRATSHNQETALPTVSYSLILFQREPGEMNQTQLGGLSSTNIEGAAFLPARDDFVDILDPEEDGIEAPKDSHGGWPTGQVMGKTWSKALDEITIDLSLDCEDQAHANEIANWLSVRGWNDWWSKSHNE